MSTKALALILLTTLTAPNINGSIKEIDKSTLPSTVEEIVQTHHAPFVVRGYASEVTGPKWTPESLNKNYGDTIVSWYNNWDEINEVYAETGDASGFNNDAIQVPLSHHFKNKPAYIEDHNLLKKHPELVEQLKFPTTSKNNSHVLFLGAGKTTTRVHSHEDQETFLIQMYGIKTLVLMPPNSCDALKCILDFGYHNNDSEQILDRVSAFDPFNPDLKRFPDIKNIDIIWVDLAPGDMLYSPLGWFHTAQSVSEESITVTSFSGDNVP